MVSEPNAPAMHDCRAPPSAIIVSLGMCAHLTYFILVSRTY